MVKLCLCIKRWNYFNFFSTPLPEVPINPVGFMRRFKHSKTKNKTFFCFTGSETKNVMSET